MRSVPLFLFSSREEKEGCGGEEEEREGIEIDEYANVSSSSRVGSIRFGRLVASTERVSLHFTVYTECTHSRLIACLPVYMYYLPARLATIH